MLETKEEKDLPAYKKLLNMLYGWVDSTRSATAEKIAALQELVQQARAQDFDKDWREINPSCLSRIVGSYKIPDKLVDEIFELLWKKGADIHYSTGLGNCLHAAICRNRENIFDILLQEKVNVNARNHLGKTPLYIAVDLKYTYYVKKLLEVEGIDLTIKDNKGNTVRDLYRKLVFEDPSHEIVNILRGRLWRIEQTGQSRSQFTFYNNHKYIDPQRQDTNLRQRKHAGSVVKGRYLQEELIPLKAEENETLEQKTSADSKSLFDVFRNWWGR